MKSSRTFACKTLVLASLTMSGCAPDIDSEKESASKLLPLCGRQFSADEYKERLVAANGKDPGAIIDLFMHHSSKGDAAGQYLWSRAYQDLGLTDANGWWMARAHMLKLARWGGEANCDEATATAERIMQGITEADAATDSRIASSLEDATHFLSNPEHCDRTASPPAGTAGSTLAEIKAASEAALTGNNQCSAP